MKQNSSKTHRRSLHSKRISGSHLPAKSDTVELCSSDIANLLKRTDVGERVEIITNTRIHDKTTTKRPTSRGRKHFSKNSIASSEGSKSKPLDNNNQSTKKPRSTKSDANNMSSSTLGSEHSESQMSDKRRKNLGYDANLRSTSTKYKIYPVNASNRSPGSLKSNYVDDSNSVHRVKTGSSRTNRISKSQVHLRKTRQKSSNKKVSQGSRSGVRNVRKSTETSSVENHAALQSKLLHPPKNDSKSGGSSGSDWPEWSDSDSRPGGMSTVQNCSNSPSQTVGQPEVKFHKSSDSETDYVSSEIVHPQGSIFDGLTSSEVRREEPIAVSGGHTSSAESLDSSKYKKQQDFAELLNRQVQQKEERRKSEKLEILRQEKRQLEEMMSYNPWGRPGCGAPIMDRSGNTVTNRHEAILVSREISEHPNIPTPTNAATTAHPDSSSGTAAAALSVNRSATPVAVNRSSALGSVGFVSSMMNDNELAGMREKSEKLRRDEQQHELQVQIAVKRQEREEIKRRDDELERRDEERIEKERYELAARYAREIGTPPPDPNMYFSRKSDPSIQFKQNPKLSVNTSLPVSKDPQSTVSSNTSQTSETEGLYNSKNSQSMKSPIMSKHVSKHNVRSPSMIMATGAVSGSASKSRSKRSPTAVNKGDSKSIIQKNAVGKDTNEMESLVVKLVIENDRLKESLKQQQNLREARESKSASTTNSMKTKKRSQRRILGQNHQNMQDVELVSRSSSGVQERPSRRNSLSEARRANPKTSTIRRRRGSIKRPTATVPKSAGWPTKTVSRDDKAVNLDRSAWSHFVLPSTDGSRPPSPNIAAADRYSRPPSRARATLSAGADLTFSRDELDQLMAF
eukprot:162365_1